MSNVVPFDPRDAEGQADVPVNYEAEQAILGALLRSNGLYDSVCDFLGPEHFADPDAALVYETVCGLLNAGRPATPVTVHAALEREERLVGEQHSSMKGYLAELVGDVVMLTGQAVAHYGEVVVGYWEQRQVLQLAGEIQVGEIRQAAEAESWLLEIGEALERGKGPTNLATAAYQAVQALERNMRALAAGETIGLPTGLVKLDELLLMKPDNLIVVGARPSMGKSALAATIAANVAKAGRPVYLWSGEMSSEQLTNRLLSRFAGVPLTRIERSDLMVEQFQAVDEARRVVAPWPLHIDDDPGLSPGMLQARLRRHKRRFGLALVVVDYLQLMAPSDRRRSDNRTNDVSDISRGLKALAKELGVPVMALSQLSRGVESRDDKRPVLNDLRDSGSIEQDADAVMFLYRESYYAQRERPRRKGSESAAAYDDRVADHEAHLAQLAGLCEAIVAKQRQGPTGMAKLHFDEAHTAFTDLARAGQQEEEIPF